MPPLALQNLHKTDASNERHRPTDTHQLPGPCSCDGTARARALSMSCTCQMACRLRRLHGHIAFHSRAFERDSPVCVGHGATAESSTRGGITRVTDGLLGGHVHPSICVAPSSGDVIVVFNRGPGDANELLLCRSTDKGVSWTEPVVLPSSVDRCPGGVYPGALTVLKSGEIVLHWYRYGPTAAQRWQYGPEYCVSSDDGHTFGPPQLIDTPDRPDRIRIGILRR